jgi:hypothetical protein
VFGICAVICVVLSLVVVPAAYSVPSLPINLTTTEEAKLLPVITILVGKAELSKLDVLTLETVGGLSIDLKPVPS